MLGSHSHPLPITVIIITSIIFLIITITCTPRPALAPEDARLLHIAGPASRHQGLLAQFLVPRVPSILQYHARSHLSLPSSLTFPLPLCSAGPPPTDRWERPRGASPLVKGGFPDHTRVTEASVRWAGGGVFLQVQGERPMQHRHLPRDLAWEKPVPAGWACPGVWRRLPRRRLPRRRLPLSYCSGTN